MAELFGYEIKRKKESDKAKSFVAPSDEEGTLDIAGGAGFFGQYLSYDKAARNEYDLIRKYRTTAENPECDQAIEDIINEAIIADELDLSVESKEQADKIIEIMENAVKLAVPNKVDYESGKTWGDIYG